MWRAWLVAEGLLRPSGRRRAKSSYMAPPIQQRTSMKHYCLKTIRGSKPVVRDRPVKKMGEFVAKRVVPKVRVELTRPFGQWFLSSLPIVHHRLQGITNVHVLARLQIGRPRQWTSAMYWQTPANIKAIRGSIRGSWRSFGLYVPRYLFLCFRCW
jgi:hypothetical protein